MSYQVLKNYLLTFFKEWTKQFTGLWVVFVKIPQPLNAGKLVTVYFPYILFLLLGARRWIITLSNTKMYERLVLFYLFWVYVIIEGELHKSSLLHTLSSRAKRGWTGCILFFLDIEIFTRLLQWRCLILQCLLHI